MTEKEIKAFFKQKTPKLNVDINQYWIVEADDYHEFRWVKSYYKQAGIDVEYDELGCDGQYIAIFWIGERPTEYIEKYKEINFFE